MSANGRTMFEGFKGLFYCETKHKTFFLQVQNWVVKLGSGVAMVIFMEC